jgi:tripeptide aminopeptidase
MIAALETALLAKLPAITEESIRIQQIPAPTFHEERRASYVKHRWAENPRLTDVSVDDVHNVYARLPGQNPEAPALLISAHTDTVFDEGTPLTVKRYKNTIAAPGIGDNSLAVGALLALADVLSMENIALPRDIWFVANSREEGLGDLGGMKAVMARLRAYVSHAVILEGMALGRIYHSGIAVRRLEIRCVGPGGHSWLHYGRPSAIHSLMKLGAHIAALHPPEHPRTTFNIGVVNGGSTVNTIAAEASMLLDLRSESPDALANLERTVMRLIEAAKIPELQITSKVVGDRPSGAIARTHPLVLLASDALQAVNIKPVLETGSTDANVPLAEGLPAVTVGVVYGGNAHRLDEYIDTKPLPEGMRQLLLLSTGIACGLI